MFHLREPTVFSDQKSSQYFIVHKLYICHLYNMAAQKPKLVNIFRTIEPPLSGHTLLNGHMSKSQRYLVYIIKEKTSIERPPLLSGRGHLRVVPSSVFFNNYNLLYTVSQFFQTQFQTAKNLFVEILINMYPLTHRLAVI